MRIVFMGTPAYAVPSLITAAKNGEVAGVYTQPDRPTGRKQILTPSPVKECALRLGLPVFQPERIRRRAETDRLRSLAPDLILVAAYGQILPETILSIPPRGAVNLHASLLPKYRGASPVQRCILNGDTETGVTVMKMNAGIDTGDILMQTRVAIGGEDTAEDLTRRLAEAAGALTGELLSMLKEDREPEAVAQEESEATYAPPLTREDGRIDWRQPARRVYNQVRGLFPWPSAYTEWDGKQLTIWKARTGKEEAAGLAPGTAVVRGKKLYAACSDFLQGNHPDGAVFGGLGTREP